MTNKINGIDVSECKYYDDGTCCNEDVLTLSCDKTDCIYKQLKRLQEENERLKKPCLVMPKVNQLAVPIEKYEKLYKALEEIREIALKGADGNDCTFCNNIFKIINEVLNDRD